MKTKVFILCMLFSMLGITMHAQYYYATYGDAVDIKLTSGDRILNMAPGHGQVMAGFAGTHLQVTRTDKFGVPVFNNYYRFFNPNDPFMTITSIQVVEADANTIVTIGSYIEPITLEEGFFFLSLTPTGGLITLKFLPWVIPGVTNMVVNGIFEAGGTDFYIAGSARYTTGLNSSIFPMSARFDINGNNLWARIYTIAGTGWVVQGADIELYAATNQLFMVGLHRFTSNAQSDGFMFRIDPANGNSFPGGRYGTLTSNDSFIAITTCNSTTLGGVPGLILAGQTNARVANPINYDSWAMKVSSVGAVLGTQVYDYSPTADKDNFCSDVVERYKGGVYTYFFTGWVNGGIIGLNDVHVVKTNDVLSSNGNYTYGTATLDEFGDNAVVDNAFFGGGLSVMGFVNQTAVDRDMLNVRTYFNGVTACNSYIGVKNTHPGPPIITDFGTVPANSVTSYTPHLTIISVPHVIVCTAASVAGGSNAKMAENADEAIQDFNIDINAVSGVNNLSAITISATESVNATVEVVNLLGATLFRSEMKLNEGNNTLPDTGDLATGIVVVRVVAENGMVFTKKVLIQ